MHCWKTAIELNTNLGEGFLDRKAPAIVDSHAPALLIAIGAFFYSMDHEVGFTCTNTVL